MLKKSNLLWGVGLISLIMVLATGVAAQSIAQSADQMIIAGVDTFQHPQYMIHISTIRPIDAYMWTGDAYFNQGYIKEDGNIHAGDGFHNYRGWAKFDITAFPAGADVISMTLTAFTDSTGGPNHLLYVKGLTLDPESASAGYLWYDIGEEGFNLSSGSDAMRSIGSHNIALNSDAMNDLENHIHTAFTWWAVGFQEEGDDDPSGRFRGHTYLEPYIPYITVHWAAPTLSVMPTNSLTFTWSAGLPAPPAQNFIVTNGGPPNLYWNASRNNYAPWLALIDTSGGPLIYLQHDTCTASIVGSFPGGGSHTATVTFTAPGALNSPQTRTVYLNCSPTVPSLSYPADGAIGVPFNPTTFGWVHIYYVTAYHIQVATDSNFTDSSIYVQDSSLTNYNFQYPLNPSTQYWWRVRARNQYAWSGWSTIYTFTTAALVPNVQITMAPISFPIVIPPGGGSFNFLAILENLESSAQNVDAWIMQRVPSGSWQGPMLGPININLAGGWTIIRERTQYVPGTAAPGTYTYYGYVGDYPAVKWDSSYFTYTKLGSGDGGQADDWVNYGEPFPGEEMTTMPTIVPQEFALLGPSPNPFNPSTTISFSLPEAVRVSLKVYDVQGSLVATLANGWREAGTHEMTFDGSDLPSGVYLYRLQAGQHTASGKMVLMK